MSLAAIAEAEAIVTHCRPSHGLRSSSESHKDTAVLPLYEFTFFTRLPKLRLRLLAYERLFGGVLSDFRSSPISRPVSPPGTFTVSNFGPRYGPAWAQLPYPCPQTPRQQAGHKTVPDLVAGVEKSLRRGSHPHRTFRNRWHNDQQCARLSFTTASRAYCRRELERSL